MRPLKQTFVHAIVLSLALVSAVTADEPKAVTAWVASSIDYEAFLARQDMVWDRIPNRWELAPYTGNGNVGFLFYQHGQTQETSSPCMREDMIISITGCRMMARICCGSIGVVCRWVTSI